MGHVIFVLQDLFEKYLMACRVPCGLPQVAPSPMGSAARSPPVGALHALVSPWKLARRQSQLL